MPKKYDFSYDLMGVEAPKVPVSLPQILILASKNAPEHMKPAIINSLFPALGTLMHNVTFRYPDNVLHEPHFMCGIVGGQAVGKGSITPILETIAHCATRSCCHPRTRA